MKLIWPVAMMASLLPLNSCTPNLLPGDNEVEASRAVFTDPISGLQTTEFRDFDEEVFSFVPARSALIRVSDGTEFMGWNVAASRITFDMNEYRVNFGSKDDDRRAYLTQGDHPTVVDLLVENDALTVIQTVFFVPENAISAKAKGSAVYALNGAGSMNGMFVFDTETDLFICSAAGGGSTIGAPQNFTMIITAHPPIDRVRFDSVPVNGMPKQRVQFTAQAFSVTVNNGVTGLPGVQTGAEVLFDELDECTIVVEGVDDNEGGDRWRTTIYDAQIWPDGTQFKNFEGDDISTAVVTGPITGDIAITPAQE